MSKLWRDMRVALAGACGGLFAVSVFLLAARVDSYYAYLNWLEATSYSGTYDRAIEDLWWVPVVLWHVVLSMMASLLMHRYLATDRVSPFLRWQAIGLVALIAWGLSAFIAVGMECLIRGDTTAIAQLWRYTRVISIVQFISTVFAANVLYGSAIQAASSEGIREVPQADKIEL